MDSNENRTNLLLAGWCWWSHLELFMRCKSDSELCTSYNDSSRADEALSIDGYLLLSLDNYYACEISNSPRTTKKGPCSKLRSLAGSFITRSRSAKFKSPESQISQKSSTFKIHEPVFPMTMTMTRHNYRGTCVLQIAIYVEYRRSRKSCIVALWILRALFDKPCIETTGSDKSYYSTCFFQF